MTGHCQERYQYSPSGTVLPLWFSSDETFQQLFALAAAFSLASTLSLCDQILLGSAVGVEGVLVLGEPLLCLRSATRESHSLTHSFSLSLSHSLSLSLSHTHTHSHSLTHNSLDSIPNTHDTYDETHTCTLACSVCCAAFRGAVAAEFLSFTIICRINRRVCFFGPPHTQRENHKERRSIHRQ